MYGQYCWYQCWYYKNSLCRGEQCIITYDMNHKFATSADVFNESLWFCNTELINTPVSFSFETFCRPERSVCLSAEHNVWNVPETWKYCLNCSPKPAVCDSERMISMLQIDLDLQTVVWGQVKAVQLYSVMVHYKPYIFNNLYFNYELSTLEDSPISSEQNGLRMTAPAPTVRKLWPVVWQESIKPGRFKLNIQSGWLTSCVSLCICVSICAHISNCVYLLAVLSCVFNISASFSQLNNK